MKDSKLSQELYRSAFEKVHAPQTLLKQIEKMKQEDPPKKKHIALKRAVWAAAAVIAVLVLSNLAVFAATGEPWVGRIFDWDVEPAQPMDNVREFFIENASRLGAQSASAARHDYYGGTYLDGGVQVILLTDLSRSDEFSQPGENIRFEKCTYTYSELTYAIENDFAEIRRRSRQGDKIADDFVAMSLDDKNNRIGVDVYRMTDEKVQWFRENISDAAYYVFSNTDFLPQDMVD